jgi:hypothetical protein
MSGAIPPLFVAWCPVKALGQLYLLPLHSLCDESVFLFSCIYLKITNVAVAYVETGNQASSHGSTTFVLVQRCCW